MIVVDGHLDIAFNHAVFARDPRRSALETREAEAGKAPGKWRGDCMVGLPELRRGRVAVVFSTLFLLRERDWDGPGPLENIAYRNAAEAERFARAQLDFYRELHEEGDGFRMIASREDLAAHLDGWKGGAVDDVGLVPLMEGADPIVDPGDVPEWFEAGVRMVGLAWRGTRYSGGTGEPGPLTAAGRELVPALAEAGIALDLSHAAEEAFHEALELSEGPVFASHANPRAMRNSDRELSDDMIRKLAARDGVIGIVPFNRMLVNGWDGPAAGPVPLRRVAEAIRHVADVAGRHEAVAIGSDFDGGFGAECAPTGLDTVADLSRLADVLSDAGFSDGAIEDVLGRNWLAFLERVLPASAG